MTKFRVTEKWATYAVVDIEAATAEEAHEKATEFGGSELDWVYDIDYDESLGIEVEALPEGH